MRNAVRELTPSQENYLEWIYRFSQDGPVRIRDLSAKVGVKEPSASRAISGLVQSGLVHHEAYGKIELTEEGKRVGRAIIRRDECLTRLLVEILGMDPVDADSEVHRLEHVLGDEVLARLEVLVDFAASSPAWMKRLQYRIQTEAQRIDGTGDFRIGATHTHAGSVTEKRAVKSHKLA
jgi:DtxR family Mn-dependent transcriptional regulator